MKKLSRKLMGAFLASLMLTLFLGTTALAAGKDTSVFDFVTSQSMKIPRGGSDQIKLFAKEKFKVFIVGNNSENTYAWIDNGNNSGNASVTVYIGADETSHNIGAIFYVYDRDFYDGVSIDIEGNVAPPKDAVSPAAAVAAPAPVQVAAPLLPAAQATSAAPAQYYDKFPGDYLGFNQTCADAIISAAPASVVTLNAGDDWISFNQTALTALEARRDVTVVLQFVYQGVPYTVTIPAGANVSGLADANRICGFLYLKAMFG